MDEAKTEEERSADIDRVTLRFDPSSGSLAGDEVHKDLSALARYGDTLFVASDEAAGIERLELGANGWGLHQHVDLSELIDLPDGDKTEIDIEGLDISEEDGCTWLWITGSHAVKRKLPRGEGAAADLKRLAKLGWDPNRQLIARVPLNDLGLPSRNCGKLKAQHVAFSKRGRLRKWLKDDPLLAPFLEIPSKDNGLDVEGIASKGLRIWLGLRGPVLRGLLVILEFDMKAQKDGTLKPRKLDGKQRYRTHILNGDGAGVRDLAFDGPDLLVLTGTPLAGDGQARVLRWKNAEACVESGVHGTGAVSLAKVLPYREATDNPEGLARWNDETWMILHDSPDTMRLDTAGPSYHADLWQLDD